MTEFLTGKGLSATAVRKANSISELLSCHQNQCITGRDGNVGDCAILHRIVASVPNRLQIAMVQIIANCKRGEHNFLVGGIKDNNGRLSALRAPEGIDAALAMQLCEIPRAKYGIAAAHG